MSHTNVSIPDQYTRVEQLQARLEESEFKLKRALERVVWLEREFYNIPEAINDWGYVDLSDASGRFLMTLVKKADKPLSPQASGESEG